MSRVLVFDSGVGGLTVLSALQQALPRASFIFAADNAAFPYGTWPEDRLAARVVELFSGLLAYHAPDIAVIACNTASTLVLPPLRARFEIPFVGTVPAIKPAAAATRSGLISVLATQATVARDYTRGLIEDFAAGCMVTLVPCETLASIAEGKLAGNRIDADAVSRAIAPAFREEDGRRTDHVVLACTHYPLLLEELQQQAPWPVEWIDPAPAIARRAASVLAGLEAPGGNPAPGLALFTDAEAVGDRLAAALGERYGLTRVDPLPLGARTV